MPSREAITDADVCDLAHRWKVAPDTMQRVWLSAQEYEQQMGLKERGGLRVWIISGWRSRGQQRALGRQGRPTAPDALSTHRSCPATGVDISLGLLASEFMKVTWGRAVFIQGLRWGGGGAVDPKNLIPLDWRHVDRGPRSNPR